MRTMRPMWVAPAMRLSFMRRYTVLRSTRTRAQNSAIVRNSGSGVLTTRSALRIADSSSSARSASNRSSTPDAARKADASIAGARSWRRQRRARAGSSHRVPRQVEDAEDRREQGEELGAEEQAGGDHAAL